MVQLFGNLLTRKYPDFNGDIPAKELLDWHLWPVFIGITGTYSKVESDIDLCLAVL